MVALHEERVELRVDLDEAVVGDGLLVTPLGVGVVDVADEELWLKCVNPTLGENGTWRSARRVLLTR